jgi:2',3'-cyclic-nucleotide 2'-phosphodiesterase/3'-nucleotidase
MLAHTGLTAAARTGMDENAAHHLARISGIDVMFTGHLHQIFPGPNFRDMPGLDLTKGTVFGVPTVMPGFTFQCFSGE